MKISALPNLLLRAIILIVAVVILCADYFTGPDIRFTILYVIPVAFAAWRWRLAPALLLALTMPLFRLSFIFAWHDLPTIPTATINTAIQWSTLVGISVLIARMVSLQKRILVLEGILPICSFCKKIQGADGKWETIENYITDHSEALFSHGFCPTCASQHYPEFFPKKPRS